MAKNSYIVLRAYDRPRYEVEIKRSDFLGYAARTTSEDEARDFLADIRSHHREARHVCHAFVLGPERSIQRSSDDGEPSGTAGAPILKAIVSRKTAPGQTMLSDVTVAVVRYFGGIKLGAGGLVQTYSQTAAGVLDNAVCTTRSRMRLMTCTLPIGQEGRMESRLRSSGIRIESVDYRTGSADLTIAVVDDDDVIEAVCTKVSTLSSGAAEMTRGICDWRDQK